MTKHSIAAACALTLRQHIRLHLNQPGWYRERVKATKEIKETIKESCITGDSVAPSSPSISTRGIVSKTSVIAPPYYDLYSSLRGPQGREKGFPSTSACGVPIQRHIPPQPDHVHDLSW